MIFLRRRCAFCHSGIKVTPVSGIQLGTDYELCCPICGYPFKVLIPEDELGLSDLETEAST